MNSQTLAPGALTIVTGASQNHARPLLNLLMSLDRYESGTRVIVYDLGLSPGVLKILRQRQRTVVPFRFEDYPAHVDRHNLLTYAWKPAIVQEVVQAYGFPMLWLDAGDLVHEPLDRIRAEIARVGFYSPLSGGTIADWTHPAALQAMRVEPELLGEMNRNGAIIGFGDHPLGRDLAESWYEASMVAENICPPGTTDQNHRFDQAILSILIARLRRRHGLTLTERHLDVTTHNDRLSREEAKAFVRTNILPARLKPGGSGRDLPPKTRPQRWMRFIARALRAQGASQR